MSRHTSQPGSEQLRRGYREDLAAIHAAGFTGIARNSARELLSRLPAGSRVIELGCGDGTTAELLSEAGHDIHGIDLSPAMVALARKRAPRASFEVGSFVDWRLPSECDAIVAVGEVLGYVFDPRAGKDTLEAVLARCKRALRRGGLVMFDLAGRERVVAPEQRGWVEGEDWAVLVQSTADEEFLTRRIVAFRNTGDGRYSRSEETHRLQLHRPSEVLRQLRAAGFAARTLASGYNGVLLPQGITAYLARKRHIDD